MKISITSWGFEPTNPYSELEDHDYLEFFLQLEKFAICLQWYFFPVSRWGFGDCQIKLYRRWIKIDLPTLWFRVDMSILPQKIKP